VAAFFQVSADMAVAVDVPDGHGHRYVKDVAEQLSRLVDWIDVAMVTRGVGVMPRRGVSRDLQIISG
jgi:uncharacterized membrane protein